MIFRISYTIPFPEDRNVFLLNFYILLSHSQGTAMCKTPATVVNDNSSLLFVLVIGMRRQYRDTGFSEYCKLDGVLPGNAVEFYKRSI